MHYDCTEGPALAITFEINSEQRLVNLDCIGQRLASLSCNAIFCAHETAKQVSIPTRTSQRENYCE
eukprot:2792334-Pleurochrysis_carterae.AAC.7